MGTFADSVKVNFYQKNNGLTTAPYLPVLDSSGAPLGAITAANLASVLGALGNVIQVNASNDLNNFENTCILYNNSVSSIPLNAPEYVHGFAGSFIVLKTESYTIQLAFYRTGALLFYRTCTGGTWNSWYKISSTQYSD